MVDSKTPTWRFAPTGGGAEYGKSPGQHYFANDAVTKMVREVLQNSLDHPSRGVDTVDVTFKLIHVAPDEISAAELKPHIEASLAEVTRDRDTEAMKHYQKMLQAISQPEIPCLAITDSGTTGLQGPNWRNLIFREGTPTNSSGQAKGGSFGIGKNAPFNLSSCNTVIYSTRYVSIPAKGRVQHMAGRSQLVSHDDPDNPEDPDHKLQQIGFLGLHDMRPNLPVEGPQTPQPFLLNQQGTGVFIVSFDTSIHHDWVNETAKATVTQFFYAIHARKMTVTIEGDPGTETRVISHDTMDIELENCAPNDPTRHYYQAITENGPVPTIPTGRLDQMGSLQVWTSTAKGAPRRTAHINRRGMLITEARTFSDNPFYPSGGTGWPHWCAVTMAHDEGADEFIRRMEPPAHDSIHYRQLRDPNEREAAMLELRHQREQITEMIRTRIDAELGKASTNVDELAELFPDVPDLGQGIHDLKWHERQHTERPNDIVDVVPEESEENDRVDDPEGTQETETPHEPSGEGHGGGHSPFSEPENRPASPKPTDNAIRHTRIIRTGPSTLVMSFTTPSQPMESIRFGIRSAGEQYQKREMDIPFQGTPQTDNFLVKATMEGDSLVVSGPPDTPVVLHLQLDSEEAPYHSYSIVQIQHEPQPA